MIKLLRKRLQMQAFAFSLENLIVESQNNAQLLNIIGHKDLSQEELKLSLRMFSRFIKTPKSFENKLDPRFQHFVQQIEPGLDLMQDHGIRINVDILDFFYFRRKYQLIDPQALNSRHIQKMINQKLETLLEKDILSFRNLVNILYDLSQENQKLYQKIVQSIHDQLQNRPELLSFYTAIQLAQTISNNPFRTRKEILLFKLVMENVIENPQGDFQLSMKSAFLLYSSKVQTEFVPSIYQKYNWILPLKHELSSNLDQLEPIALDQILQSYQHFLPDVYNDLLYNMKDHFHNWIRGNPQSLQSKSLLKFIQNYLKIRHLKPNILIFDFELVFKEVGERIKFDSYFQHTRNLETLLKLVQSIDPKEQVQFIGLILEALTHCLETGKITLNSFYLSEFLIFHKVDIGPYLQAYRDNADKDVLKNYLILNHYQQHFGDEFKAQEQELQSQLAQVNLSDMQNIRNIAECLVITQETKQINNLMLDNLLKTFKMQATKKLLLLNQTQSNYEPILSYFLEHSEKINIFDFLSQFTEQDFLLSKFNFKLFITFFEHVTEQNVLRKSTDLPIGKLQLFFLNNNDIYYKLKTNEKLTHKFYTIMINLQKLQKGTHAFAHSYSIYLKQKAFGSTHIYNIMFLNNAFKLYNQTVLSQEKKTEYLNDIHQKTLRILMNHKAIHSKTLIDFYQKYSQIQADEIFSLQIMNYVAISKNTNLLQTYNLEQAYTQIIEKVIEKPDPQNKNLRYLQCIPPKDFKKNSELLHEKLKIELSSDPQAYKYIQLIVNLPNKYVQQNYKLYHGYLKQLILKFETFQDSLSVNQIIMIMQTLQECNVKSPQIYEQIIYQLNENQYQQINKSEKVQILLILSKIGLIENDLFEKICRDFFQKKYLEFQFFRQVVSALDRSGFTSDLIEEKIVHFYKTLSYVSDISVLDYLHYLMVIGHKEELSEIKNALPIIKKLFSQNFNIILGEKTLQRLFDMHLIVSHIYPQEKELINTLESLLKHLKIKHKLQTKYENYQVVGQKMEILEILSQMQVKSELYRPIANDLERIYIKEQNLLLVQVQSSDVNFNRQSYCGRFLLEKRLFDNIDIEVKFVSFVEFDDMLDPLDKIEFLMELGVQNNNQTGEYDWEKIQQVTQKYASKDKF